MSDPAPKTPASFRISGERAQRRRTHIGISIVYLGVALVGFAGIQPVLWLGALAVIIGGVLAALSRPKATGHVLTPHNIRRIARVAELPEVGTTIVVYLCLIAGFTSAIKLATGM